MMFGSTRLAGGRVIATALLLSACQSVAVDVDVDVDLGDEPAASSTGDAPEPEPADSSSGEAPADSTGDSGEPEPPALPECGNGVVEAGEECDADVAALCELDGFSCLYRRFVFVSQERRDGWSWAADRDAADEACRTEAAAAGLAVAGSYVAMMARDGEGPATGWQQPGAEYRNTCTGAPLAGTIDPWTDGFVWQVEANTAPADWPACDAAGAPVAPPSLPVSGGEWRAAWWSFSTSAGTLAAGACAPGEELGAGGWIKGDPSPDLELDGRPLPCSAALPVLCVAAISG